MRTGLRGSRCRHDGSRCGASAVKLWLRRVGLMRVRESGYITRTQTRSLVSEEAGELLPRLWDVLP